jgi:hypothetical protein
LIVIGTPCNGPRTSPRASAASAASASARAFSVDSDDTVDGFIKVIYANKKIVQCFSTRNFSLLNLLCQFDG